METSVDTADKHQQPGRVGFLLKVALVLQIVGLCVSVELSRIHYLTHTDPTYQSVCSINEKINCKTVAESPFSVFLGVPVSALGLFGYLLMTFLVVAGLRRRRLTPTWPIGALFAIYLFSLAASGALGYISVVRIDSLCIFCTTLYGINAALCGVGSALLIAARLGPLQALRKDLAALFSKPILALGLTGGWGGALVALVLLMPAYWQHVDWSALPDLTSGQDTGGCHWIGAEDPLVTVVEFSDYQCPHCRRAHREMRAKAAKHPDEVRLIHHHLPLDSACNTDIKGQFHDRACEFSKAAECAGEQDMFWEMNDALFAIQDTVSPDDVELQRLAVRVGLDRSGFKACMAEEGIPECILKDIAKARKRQVAGTPTFFIGDTPYLGQVPADVLQAAVDRARSAKK